MILFSDFLPPIFFKVYNYFKSKLIIGDKLFDGDDKLFMESIVGCYNILEFGAGKSTLVLNNLKDLSVWSVESDFAFVSYLLNKINPDKVHIHYANIGKTTSWGKPMDYSKRNDFSQYFLCWVGVFKPDFVLIDGRFRVACFFSVLLNAEAGTKILFDDYNRRSSYHIVEEYIKPFCRNKDQALFIVPNFSDFDKSLISSELNNFKYVIE
jgi:hypothetical protein